MFRSSRILKFDRKGRQKMRIINKKKSSVDGQCGIQIETFNIVQIKEEIEFQHIPSFHNKKITMHLLESLIKLLPKKPTLLFFRKRTQ